MSALAKVRLLGSINLPRSLHAFGANLILIPLGVGASILIARSIGPEGKGQLDLIVATATLLVMVLGLSLPAGVTFVVARGRIGLRPLAARLISITLAQVVAAVTVLIILRRVGVDASFLPVQAGDWVIAGIAAYFCFEMLANYWRAMLNGKQQIVAVNNCELVGRFSQVFLLFVLAGILHLNGSRLSVVSLFVLSLGVTIFINILLLRSLEPHWSEPSNDGSFREVVGFALPSYLGNLTQFLNYRLDVFVVSIFAGAAAVGRYTLATSLAQLLWLLSNAAASVLLPKVAAGGAGDTAPHTARVTRLTLSASIVSGLLLAAFASYALPLLYGERFRPSVAALLCLLPGVVAFSTVNVLAAYIGGSGKPRLNLYVALASLVVTITLDLLLIPRLGIVGAALASTASYTLSAVLTIRLFIRETATPLREVLIINADDLKLFTSLVRPLLARLRPQQAN